MTLQFHKWLAVLTTETLVVAIAFATACPALELVRIGQINSADGTGAVAYDASSNTILSTNDELKVQIHDFGDGTTFSLSSEVDLSASVEGARFVSGVAADPNGRGFGVATVIPTDNSIFGKVVFFNTANGQILNSVDVGFNPDNVAFHPDGTKILVANEAELGAVSDPAGSISVIDISGITSLADVATLPQTNVSTWDFSAVNLGVGVSLDDVRVDPVNATQPHLDLEPESIVGAGNNAYVTLQENNAIAVFDLVTNKWTAIHNLGTIEQLIDASDRDGPGVPRGAALIDDLVHGLPQPDGIITYQANGITYLATANEGDARDDFDFADHGIEGNPLIDPNTLADLSGRYTTDPANPVDPTDDAILGRLGISPIDGDTDGDGDIDTPTMFGTRSFSIWNAETGERVFDSGSGIAEVTLAETPTLFNGGSEDDFDRRSDNKGSEPESIVVGEIGDQTLAFVALERTGGVLMYDITDPNNVTLLDYVNTHLETGSISPEGLTFISATNRMDGTNYLVLGYEESGSIEVFSIVPEPSSLTLLAGFLGGLGLLQRSRYRRRPSIQSLS